ncbi:hypothetical protein DYQ94_06420 [Xanthomonas sp. LMG 8993]|uniref:hypothetical protein n=1 Tax=Xanthomonas TaxID=338 RepID=UPI0013713507|nr:MULTISPECIES: hypothetical protein [Xanthomonas]MBB4768652.1 hypothetical protein [Xanthomonas arboricola]MXV46549.1 hypothetical protein [Xanthomonas sp. LMG 8993]
MDLTPTTELEAVNEMLAVIGEQPVSALEAVGNTDVAIAIRTLRGVSREVQTTAWWFNTDESYTFVLNAENRVPLPNLILSIRPLGRGSSRIAHRNGFLYDLTNATDVFAEDAAPSAKVVWFMDFELLPETVRRYIAIRAARIFQKNVLGSESLNGFTEDHEGAALALLVDESHDFEFAAGANFLNDDPDTSAIANRT